MVGSAIGDGAARCFRRCRARCESGETPHALYPHPARSRPHQWNPPAQTVYDRGTNATTPDESFSIAEADEVGDASSPPSGRDPALRPALYSAGVVPWRVGWDTRRIEASLNNAQRSGDAHIRPTTHTLYHTPAPS